MHGNPSSGGHLLMLTFFWYLNERMGQAKLPSSAEEGWPRPQENIAKLPFGADGVVLVKNSLASTTPSARTMVASRLSLIAHPPLPRLRRGVRSPGNVH